MGRLEGVVEDAPDLVGELVWVGCVYAPIDLLEGVVESVDLVEEVLDVFGVRGR